MKKALYYFCIFSFTFGVRSYGQKIIPLYEGKAPGSEELNYAETEYRDPITDRLMLRNVVDPTLAVYQPEKSKINSTSVIICPGGGNIWLSYESEGTMVAEWLAQKGITAFVLKYRLDKTIESEEEFNKVMKAFVRSITSTTENNDTARTSLNSFVVARYDRYFGGEDGIQALKYVRQHAKEYGVDPNKVGIMGFSAGARVTMHVVLNSDSGNLPNFAAPIYGGRLSNITIPENAPPLFILCAADDPVAKGSPDLYKEWRAAGYSAELHIYSKGGHGFGMNKQNMPVDTWIERFYDWLQTNGF